MIVINKFVTYMYVHKNLHGAWLLGHPVYERLSIIALETLTKAFYIS